MVHSIQLRKKVLAALDRGESAASIARRFEIGERTVYRLQQRRRAGRPIEPDKCGPRRPTKLTPADDAVLREQIRLRPGITAQELIPQLGVEVAISTVCRRLKRLGLSLKKSR